MSALYAIVLAGGSGTRFWPASRRARPKQLLPIAPGMQEPLITATVERLAKRVAPERTLIATGAHLVAATRAALPKLPESSFLGEPAARNTAACIAWVTAIALRRDPDALLMVLPSDHHIADAQGFDAALDRALRSAQDGAITTIGITPSRPDTGYGYIERGAEVSPGVHRVTRFVEKPDRTRAEAYVASGRYVWNAGMFFFRGRTMLDAVERHLPELAAGIREIERAAAAGSDAERRVTEAVFPTLPAVSIDVGVMEREDVLHVVPASFGWSDLGSWETAWELASRDADGNAAPEDALLVGSRDNLVCDLRTGDKKPRIVGVGLKGYCVIATDDAFLVIPRDRAQDVKLAVEALARSGRTDEL
jgi:mannose-1-phosphate guanylyltransferase